MIILAPSLNLPAEMCGGIVIVQPSPKALRMSAVPRVSATKRWQRLHSQARNSRPCRHLHARHVLLVKPGPLGERVVGHYVPFDEAEDGCDDSDLHDLNLERSKASQ